MAGPVTPSFEAVVEAFFRDRDAPTATPEELHPGLVIERTALCSAFARLSRIPKSGDTGETAGTSAAELIEAFTRTIRVAAEFVRAQHAPSSHVWSSNIFGAIAVKFDSPGLRIKCEQSYSNLTASDTAYRLDVY
jgi:hypothetical protein